MHDGSEQNLEEGSSVELKSVDREEAREPLITQGTAKTDKDEPSLSSIDDPLYEQIKREVQARNEISESEVPTDKAEPIYAQVREN